MRVELFMPLISSILRGSLGFAVVSVAAFSVWAFGGAWFFQHGGEVVMYAGCSLVFMGLSGLLLHPLLEGPRRVWRFYGIFFPAFFVYAVAWCAAYMFMGEGLGEWVGSLAGSFAFTMVMSIILGTYRALLPAALVMFLTHSAGYFVGEKICYTFLHSVSSELVWGLLYGLGFGAGIGYAFWAMQRK